MMASKKTLHITNGDCAVDALMSAGIEGEFLPWRDVLYLGPVLDEAELSSFDLHRIEFIANKRWAVLEDVKSNFAERRQVFENLDAYDQINLWFEHDLYDQLQLLQIIHFLTKSWSRHQTVKLMFANNYLTALNQHELHKLSENAQSLGLQHCNTASAHWLAFTAANPLKLQKISENKVDEFPYIKRAWQRLFLEYPDFHTGISVTEKIILSLAENGADKVELFKKYQQQEHDRFMGDTQFYDLVDGLLNCQTPLLQFNEDNQLILNTTEQGKLTLQGKLHNLAHNSINKWIGGVHLHAQPIWCYDRQENQFKQWSQS